jgi:hypothetical protein
MKPKKGGGRAVITVELGGDMLALLDQLVEWEQRYLVTRQVTRSAIVRKAVWQMYQAATQAYRDEGGKTDAE